MMLASKVVKRDSKIIILIHLSKSMSLSEGSYRIGSSFAGTINKGRGRREPDVGDQRRMPKN